MLIVNLLLSNSDLVSVSGDKAAGAVARFSEFDVFQRWIAAAGVGLQSTIHNLGLF